MSLISISYRVYVIFTIIILSSFFIGLLIELNTNKNFINAISCNKTTGYNKINLSLFQLNETNNNKNCENLENITEQSNNLIFFVIIFWAYAIRKDLYEAWNYIKTKFD